MKTIDSTWSRNDLLDEINRLRNISERQSENLAQALKEKNDLDRITRTGNLCADYERIAIQNRLDDLQKKYDNLTQVFTTTQMLFEPVKPKFRVGQYVVVLTNNPKWDSVNGEPYRIDKAVVRITSVTTNIFPKGSPFCYSHNGKEGDYSIPEVWFRALRPEEI